MNTAKNNINELFRACETLRQKGVSDELTLMTFNANQTQGYALTDTNKILCYFYRFPTDSDKEATVVFTEDGRGTDKGIVFTGTTAGELLAGFIDGCQDKLRHKSTHIDCIKILKFVKIISDHINDTEVYTYIGAALDKYERIKFRTNLLLEVVAETKVGEFKLNDNPPNLTFSRPE